MLPSRTTCIRCCASHDALRARSLPILSCLLALNARLIVRILFFYLIFIWMSCIIANPADYCSPLLNILGDNTILGQLRDLVNKLSNSRPFGNTR